MEIVIENPTEIVSRGHCSAVPSAEYFASLANQRLLTGAEVDVPPSSVRRVDRSGLLEMPQTQHTETTLRRIDRSGLLESVSEVPDHIAYAKSRLLDQSGAANVAERHLTGAEITKEDGPSSLTLPRFRVRERRGSYDPSSQNLELKTSKESGGSLQQGIPKDKMLTGLNHVEQMVARFSPSRTPTPTESAVERLKMKPDGVGIGRLSPRPRNDHRVSSPAALSIPDVIEAHEPPNTNNSRINGSGNHNESSVPEGERAEAEGCEHTAIESLEEGRVSFKTTGKKILHNENIQTLRVIILSEQL